MSSIMDLLSRMTTPQERFSQLLQIQGLQANRSAPGSVDPNAQSTGSVPAPSGGPGTTVTGGDTQFPYQTYPMPYGGVPDNMMTRWGITLQPGPMRSLLQIARQDPLMPGASEVGKIDQGYRSYAAQQAAYASKPGVAAPPGHSYHGEGLAIDASFWSQNPQLAAALTAAGWNQFDRGAEPWHYSYGVTG